MNLWFAPAGTQCLIHNSHPFLEYHVQIAGLGSMQKFRSDSAASLYEEQGLVPGAGHGLYPVQPDGTGGYRYPWHQYVAHTDCLWLAVEMIAEGPAPRRVPDPSPERPPGPPPGPPPAPQAGPAPTAPTGLQTGPGWGPDACCAFHARR